MTYWRTGRKLGRTIYAQLDQDPSDYDMFIGIMDSPELAQHVVDAHNVAVQAFGAPAPRIHDGDIATTYLLNQPETT